MLAKERNALEEALSISTDHGAPRAARTPPPLKTDSPSSMSGASSRLRTTPLLLETFRIALTSIPELRLWVVGDGSERGATERMAADLGVAAQVTFWGQQLEVAPFFSAADAFIMSSRSEGLPMSLLQAFSLGLPAIVTDVGGMAEVVRLCQGGIVVPTVDPEGMARGISRLAGSAAERERFPANAGAAFHERFSLKAMADAYVDLYRSTSRSGCSEGIERP